MKKLVGLVLFFVLCMSCHSADKSSFEQEISDIMKAYQAVGVSVVVVKDNKICYSQTFGYNPDYNDSTLRKPIPDNGIYYIASVSKTFIGTAIMQLVEKKKLKLDDDVNQYLPFRVCNPHYPDVPITVRMLLCHRSTINDKQYGWNLDQINPEKNDKWQKCYNNEMPGKVFSYCNLNYSLLGAIIENVTQMRFDEYIDRYITSPLGLEASYNLTKIDSTRLVRSYMYDKRKKQFKPSGSVYNYQYVRNVLSDYHTGESAARLSPAGGMKISAAGLAKWMMLHMNYGHLDGKRIISKKSELAMWEPQGADRNYGLGFSHYDKVIRGVRLYGMTGGAHGIHSLFFFNPEEKYGFVVICNGCTSKAANGRQMNYEIVRALYKHFIK